VNGLIVEAGATEAGPVRLVGSPLTMSAAPFTLRHPPPRLGAHNSEIIGELGLRQEAAE
jgi:formyl-CoA transferase